MQGGLQISIDGCSAGLPKCIVKGSPGKGRCGTQMSVEVGGEPKPKDTLSQLIPLIPDILGHQVSGSIPNRSGGCA